MVWAGHRISGPERAPLTLDGSYTPTFREVSMSDQSIPASVVYKEIPGFPGYRVGSDGSVWSCWKRKSLGRRRGIGRFLSEEWFPLKPYVDNVGRPSVVLGAGMARRTMRICRLVLLAFVGPCPEGMEACHDDGNPANNHPGNLRWDTERNNQRDRRRHGTVYEGERQHLAKLTCENVREIRRRRTNGESAPSLAKAFGVSLCTMCRVINGETWKHVK
jgi:hypothetical protein